MDKFYEDETQLKTWHDEKYMALLALIYEEKWSD